MECVRERDRDWEEQSNILINIIIFIIVILIYYHFFVFHFLNVKFMLSKMIASPPHTTSRQKSSTTEFPLVLLSFYSHETQWNCLEVLIVTFFSLSHKCHYHSVFPQRTAAVDGLLSFLLLFHGNKTNEIHYCSNSFRQIFFHSRNVIAFVVFDDDECNKIDSVYHCADVSVLAIFFSTCL